jgi:hypothetical protein
VFWKGIQVARHIFLDFGGIIGNQITLCFLKRLSDRGRRPAASVTQLCLSITRHIITCQYGFALITHHHIPLLSIMRQCMLLWKKNAYCHESLLSYLTIMLFPYIYHNPCRHHVSYWGRDFVTCVFYELDVEPRRCCRWGRLLCFQPGRSAILWHCFTSSHERQFLISPHPMLSLQPWFFYTCGTIKLNFFVIMIF